MSQQQRSRRMRGLESAHQDHSASGGSAQQERSRTTVSLYPWSWERYRGSVASSVEARSTWQQPAQDAVASEEHGDGRRSQEGLSVDEQAADHSKLVKSKLQEAAWSRR